MRDNARRLLTLLTVILALWLVLGFWPLSIGNQVIFSLCILLAGGAALWRQRRRAVSRQRSEIVLPPEDFQGRWFWSAGIPTVCFPGVRRTAKPVTAGIYGRQRGAVAAAGAVHWRRRVRRWYRRFPCCWRWYRSTTLREQLAQSLRDWRRSIVQCRTWLNGLPPVWSVFWVTPPGGQAGKAAGLPSRRRPGLRCSRRGKRPSRLPSGSGRAALPHACIRRCGWRAF